MITHTTLSTIPTTNAPRFVEQDKTDLSVIIMRRIKTHQIQAHQFQGPKITSDYSKINLTKF